jgi:putative chitinase
MKIQELLSEVKIDNKNGWGATPNNSNVDYMGLRVLMRPSVFLSLAAALSEPTSAKDVKNHLSTGGAIASPFLLIDIPDEWFNDNYKKAAVIVGHEGRNRMLAIREIEGDIPVEVHIFPVGLRNRHMSGGFIQALNSRLYPEKVKSTTISGPFFERYSEQPVSESWRQRAAAGLAGAVMALTPGQLDTGIDKNRTDVQTQPEPAPEPEAKPLSKKEFLIQFLQQNGIKGTELIAFLAQSAHETANFTKMVENGSENYFKRYEPEFNPNIAKILGNTQAGDGMKYRGRGYIHLTGRYNYRMAGRALGLPLEQHPEMVEETEIAAQTALWYWQNRVQRGVKDFSNVKQVTRRINPALQGLKSRNSHYKRFQTQFDVSQDS